MISTGGDYDRSLGQAVPGFSIHHYGLDLIAVVSTGEDVWELKVRGPVYNKTWQSVGIRWVQPNLDETVTLFPEERGGLEMFVNLEKVGQAQWRFEPPSSLSSRALVSKGDGEEDR